MPVADNNTITTVLFDLDGTLIDTAPDMAAALNVLCDEESQARLPFSEVRPMVSNGSVALITLAFGNKLCSKTLNRLKKRYLEIYENGLAVQAVHHHGFSRSHIFYGTSHTLTVLSRTYHSPGPARHPVGRDG